MNLIARISNLVDHLGLTSMVLFDLPCIMSSGRNTVTDSTVSSGKFRWL